MRVSRSYLYASFQGEDVTAAAFVATFYLLDLSSIGFQRMVPLVQTARVVTISLD